MRRFTCQCGNTLYFENTQCLECGATLGFVPEDRRVRALEPAGQDLWMVDGRYYRKCLHYARDGVCNWMMPAEDGHSFCQACRLNEVIPDLTQPDNFRHWGLLESAKRTLLFGLMRLDLPLTSRREHPGGLGFAFMEDDDNQQVLTGHAGGLITINVREADDAYREAMRKRLGEPYRTLLGHFRHESGHFYWEHLVAAHADELDAFRALFGDEREDYASALARHYSASFIPWPHDVITAYAAAHPWEDWAETWAHYLLINDTLETAEDLGIQTEAPQDFDGMLAQWRKLSTTINALGGSLGMPSLYPFVFSEAVAAKLRFIHALLERQVPSATRPATTAPSDAPSRTAANPRKPV